MKNLKIYVIMLLAAMLLACLAGCNSDSDSTTAETRKAKKTTAAPTSTELPDTSALTTTQTSTPAPTETTPIPLETTPPIPAETTPPIPVETTTDVPVEYTTPAPAETTTPIQETTAPSIRSSYQTGSYIYVDSEGYKFKVTVKISPWILQSDSATINAVWTDFYKYWGDTLPTIEDWGLSSGDRYYSKSLSNGQHSDKASFGCSSPYFDMYYAIGTFEVSNITEGFNLSESNSKNHYFPLSMHPSSDSSYGSNPYMIRAFYDTTKDIGFNYGRAYFGTLMKQNYWGPLTFIIAHGESKSPNHPDGEYREQMNSYVLSFGYDNEIEFQLELYDPAGTTPTPAETTTAKPEETTTADGSETPGEWETKGLPAIPAGCVDGLIAITSAGQSADVDVVCNLLKRAKMEFFQNNLLEASALTDSYRVLICVVGGSNKGMGAAGLDQGTEESRVKEVLAKAKELGITVICMHTGGDDRRGTLSDAFIDIVFPEADYAIIMASGDADNHIYDILVRKNTPTAYVEKASGSKDVLTYMFGK